ncbi:Starch-binding associating with outer membrane [Chitinophaga costaii]|uniref:Starch-binding associating with outer membrane n=1 Tax=Chitinophaga costaii TaxID=1335309 RepID=A0A1C4AW39_9BACT|nr:RagB/SusD family nutrient uptake outer membrane protein [Chitinophaga costaii]PUZ26765.1 RagB/SusD family nutrient uptake outer membrane protein [Chitinophaga costaii]SCB98708.1 Starch-binding associating with outer membrane [Chitinophaga costaii]
MLPVSLGLGILLMGACSKKNFLDQTETTDLNEQTVFSDSARTVEFLNNIYVDIGFSENVTRFGNGGLDAASDESEPQKSASVTTSVQFATGTVNPAIITGDAWNTCYADVRRVNVLLKNLPKAPLPSYIRNAMAGEAHFLRAWYYATLLKHYGGVPIVGDTIYSETDKISAVRNTYKECVDYILSECDLAYGALPLTRVREDYGRASGGAALGLKSRVLLYAASPLFNGGNIDPQNPLTGYTDNDPERWKLAADAAKAVMDANVYSLYEDNTTAPGYGFYYVFTQRVNTEYLLAKMQSANKELEAAWQPPSRNGGTGGFPYQETVDAFGMANGLPITDPASGYDPQNPYAGRDPRFAYSIIRDQTLLIQNNNLKEAVNIYLTADGKASSQDAVHAGTPTGYYTNKMLDANIAANNIHNSARCFPLIRYAEILLNFAEATNEHDGPEQAVYDAINLVRRRAGLSPYELPEGLSKDDMRKAIQAERRVELAFEGHRFWDVRRWKIAGTTEGLQMNGMEVRRDGNNVTYTIFPVRKHNFRDAMYFWAIPQSETAKSPELKQNPSW